MRRMWLFLTVLLILLCYGMEENSVREQLLKRKRVVDTHCDICYADYDGIETFKVETICKHYSCAECYFKMFRDGKRDCWMCRRKLTNPLAAATIKDDEKFLEFLLEEKVVNPNSRMHNGETVIFEAIRCSNFKLLKYFLEKGASLNSRDYKHFTVLHTATISQDYQISEFLIQKKSSLLNAPSLHCHFTPLHIALWHRCYDFAKFLILKNADVNQECMYGSPLTITISQGSSDDAVLDMVENLVEKNAFVSTSEYLSNTFLVEAVSKNFINVVEFLIQRGVNPNQKSFEDRKTPLFAAAEGGHLVLCELFVQVLGVDVNFETEYGQTPLMVAARGGFSDIVNLLLLYDANIHATDDFDYTALSLAAENDNYEVVKILIQQLVENEDDTDEYVDILVDSVRDGRYKLAEVILEQCVISKTTLQELIFIATSRADLEFVELLYAHGADLEACGPGDNFPLMNASSKGSVPIVNFILEKNKTIVNQCKSTGVTALWISALKGHHEIVRLLLEAGANVNQKTLIENITPLHAACIFGTIRNIRVLELMLQHDNSGIDERDCHGNTPLMYASAAGNLDLVEVLCRYGADLTIKNLEEETASQVAAKHGYEDLAHVLNFK